MPGERVSGASIRRPCPSAHMFPEDALRDHEMSAPSSPIDAPRSIRRHEGSSADRQLACPLVASSQGTPRSDHSTVHIPPWFRPGPPGRWPATTTEAGANAVACPPEHEVGMTAETTPDRSRAFRENAPTPITAETWTPDGALPEP